MSKHTPGPLFVSIEPKWPFRIITTDIAGDVVFSRDMPSQSTAHRNPQEALDGKGLDPSWNAGEINRRALADEYLRAAAPDLLAFAQWVGSPQFDSRYLFQKAQAAISKATGENK